MRIAIYTVMVIVVIYLLEALFTLIFLCRPVSAFWRDTFILGDCNDFRLMLNISAAMNILTDILIILLPIPGLKQLALPKSQKIGLMIVFFLGFGYVFCYRLIT